MNETWNTQAQCLHTKCTFLGHAYAMSVILTARVATPWSAFPPLLLPREKPALAILLSLTTVIAVGISSGAVTYDGSLNDVVLFLFIILACAILAGACSLSFIQDVLRLCFVFLFLGLTAPLASAVLAAMSLPLADAHLIDADRWLLGIRLWPGIVSTYGAHPGFIRLLSYAYVSIGWQPFLLIVLLCATRKVDAGWRFITAWGLSLLSCVIVSSWCPAVGAYVHLHIPPADVPDVLVRSAWDASVVLDRFRLGTLHELDVDALAGIITMPSFHASASVLLLWGFAHVRASSVPFSVLNVLMWISSVPIGGHYGVDVMAGSIIAIAAIKLSSMSMGALPARLSSLSRACSHLGTEER